MSALGTAVARPRGGGGSVAFPLLLIAAGAYVWLVNNAYLPTPRWTDILALWPLLLVAVGIDLLVGRRSAAGAAVATVALVALGAVALALAPSAAPAAADRAAIPLAGASTGRVDLSFGGGRLAMGGGSEGFATVRSTYEDVRTSVDQTGSRISLGIRQPDGVAMLGREWDVRLSRAVAYDLVLRLGAGEMAMDLSDVRVSTLDVDVGVGNIRLVLPRPEGERRFSIDGGLSRITIEIPRGVEARVAHEGGLTTVNGPTETAGFSVARDRVTVDVRTGLSTIRVVQLH